MKFSFLTTCQGGDPTGTGKGGQSIYGGYFEDLGWHWFCFFKMKVATDSETNFYIIQHMYTYIYIFCIYVYIIYFKGHIFTLKHIIHI